MNVDQSQLNQPPNPHTINVIESEVIITSSQNPSIITGLADVIFRGKMVRQEKPTNIQDEVSKGEVGSHVHTPTTTQSQVNVDKVGPNFQTTRVGSSDDMLR